MSTWAQLIQNSDLQALKARVPLAAIVTAGGVDLTQDGDRLIGHCPFHDDDAPSFAVWKTEEGSELCGCWACDFRPSDAYTFIQRRWGLNFSDAAKQLLEFAEQGLTTTLVTAPRVYDPQPSRMAVAKATHSAPIYEFLHDRGLDVGASDWLEREFRLRGDDEGQLVIPHLDRDGEIVAAKTRTSDTKPRTIPGGQLSALYGEWRDGRERQVILVEGESDAWMVAWQHRDQEVDVLGLPSGASADPRPAWLDTLRGRDVTLLFDSDSAGRRASATWARKLEGISETTRVAMLPDGYDACEAGASAVKAALEGAFEWRDLSGLNVTEVSGRYEKTGANGSVVISDFVFEVDHLVDVPDDATYFAVRVGKRELVVSTRTIANVQMFRTWCANHLLAWRGSQTDAIDLLERMKALAVCEPRYLGTHTTGLHDESFVLPEETIGKSSWRYVAADSAIRAEDFLRVRDGEYDLTVLRDLADMHDPAVMTPILGWLGAAPLRSICPKFPILAVVGGAGFGKTTIVSVTLQAFRFWDAAPMTLTSTTPHAVQSFVANSNGFPVWFDEYRRGARQDAKLALDQAIRDAWDGSASVKGGYGDNKVAIRYLHATAPLIVTGEDAFTETSHAERMIILDLPADGRHPQSLHRVLGAESTGLGHAYLTWLSREMQRDEFPAPPLVLNRHEQGLAVVEYGYELLSRFSGGALPALDTSLVDSSYRQITTEQPYVQALRETLDVRDHTGLELTWIEGDDLYVRAHPVCSYVERNTSIALPGSAKAMLKWFESQCVVIRNRRTVRGNAAKLVGGAKILAD